MAVHRRRIFAVLAATAALGSGTLATAQTLAAGNPSAGNHVAAAVATLTTEANDIFNDKSTTRMPLQRPRPAVAAIPPEECQSVLEAMAGKLTGDPLKDTYIRYHLMWAVNRALPSLATPLNSALLQRLIRDIPDNFKYTQKEVYTWEPYAIGKKHQALMDSCQAVVGFAPFQRRVPAPESFNYMSGAQLAKAKATYAEAKALEGKFKDVTIVANDLYNWRMTSMIWALRQYRGELYYAMMVHNPAGLDALADVILRAAPTNSERAEDMAAFLDMAYDDGIMGTYDKAAMGSAARKLKAAAEAAERAGHAAQAHNQQKPGQGPPVPIPGVAAAWDYKDWTARQRNLSESLFSVITGIETNHVPPPIAPGDFARPIPPTLPSTRVLPVPPASQPNVLNAQDITVADIDAAISRALPALERFRPPAADLDLTSWQAASLPTWPLDLWAPGQTALSTWAMLASGEPYKAGWMQRRVNWVLNIDTPSTYDRAMRLEMLTFAPPSEKPKVVPWVKRDANWLLSTVTQQGGWESNNFGFHSADWGDNANSQYAMLGLWSASQMGFEVPDPMWQRIDRYWRLGQRPTGAPDAGAWAVIPTAALQKGANLKDFKNHVSAEMTASGVMSLYVTESYLEGEKRGGVGQGLSPELMRGIDWLDHNFSLKNLDGDSDLYYYLWTIQNVGQMTGYRTFNHTDWFREGLATLINSQRPDGTWTGPKGDNVSTSFALLYLYAARGPLAICKLKIDPIPAKGRTTPAGNWNNRPNDLYNLTREISKRREVPTSWQIADLDQPVYQLIESPILYLATDRPFELSDKHLARLKEYLDAGGLLVCVPEGESFRAVESSYKSLAEKLCPGRPGVEHKTGDSSPFYNLSDTVKQNLPSTVYSNGDRPQVVLVGRDIGRELQMNRLATSGAFDFLENIYLYVTGKDAKRPRIATNYLQDGGVKTTATLAVARIKYDGDFDPEPLAMDQMKALLANDAGVQLVEQTLAPTELTKATKVAFLTVGEKATLTDAQATALKTWVANGGTLWVDATGGSAAAVDAQAALLPKLGLNDLASLDEHPIMTGRGLVNGFDNSQVETRRFYNTRSDRPQLKGMLKREHPQILVLNGDLMAAVAGMNDWGIAGLTVHSARQVVANGLLYSVEENTPPATRALECIADSVKGAKLPAPKKRGK